MAPIDGRRKVEKKRDSFAEKTCQKGCDFCVNFIIFTNVSTLIWSLINSKKSRQFWKFHIKSNEFTSSYTHQQHQQHYDYEGEKSRIRFKAYTFHLKMKKTEMVVIFFNSQIQTQISLKLRKASESFIIQIKIKIKDFLGRRILPRIIVIIFEK